MSEPLTTLALSGRQLALLRSLIESDLERSDLERIADNLPGTIPPYLADWQKEQAELHVLLGSVMFAQAVLSHG